MVDSWLHQHFVEALTATTLPLLLVTEISGLLVTTNKKTRVQDGEKTVLVM